MFFAFFSSSFIHFFRLFKIKPYLDIICLDQALSGVLGQFCLECSIKLYLDVILLDETES